MPYRSRSNRSFLQIVAAAAACLCIAAAVVGCVAVIVGLLSLAVKGVCP